MPSAPGVNVNIDDRPAAPPIEPIGTSMVAFIGETHSGTPSDIVRITGTDQYEAIFGEIDSGARPDDHMAHSVRAYFDNGGRECYVIKTDSDPENSYESVFSQLEKYDDIDIICLPTQQLVGIAEGGTNSNVVITQALSHVDKMTNRFVLVDPPDEEVNKAISWTNLPASTNAVLYYPWFEVGAVKVPPCGYVAGIWAKTEAKRGVWKAPAGVKANIKVVTGITQRVDNVDQEKLNELGINCVRSKPGYGAVVWGTRTLSTKSAAEWRYVPVRRTAFMLKESIRRGIEWAVFEPNNETLWSALRLSIESFMNGLYRAGAFQGQQASKAYFVRCGKDDTMTQADIDRGFVKITVGFAPVKPAEFVEVTIQQKLLG